MRCTCPHCSKVNRVAGWYAGTALPTQHEPEPAGLVWCGYCGERFAPVAEPIQENSTAAVDKPLIVG